MSFDSRLIFSRFWLGADYRTRFLHRNSNCRIRIPGPTVLGLGFFARSDQRDSNFISSNPLPAPMTVEVENGIDGGFFQYFFRGIKTLDFCLKRKQLQIKCVDCKTNFQLGPNSFFVFLRWKIVLKHNTYINYYMLILYFLCHNFFVSTASLPKILEPNVG